MKFDFEWAPSPLGGFRIGSFGLLWHGRGVMLYIWRLQPLHLGWPLEWPSLRWLELGWRVALGPVAVTWR